jgi:hypothetical protein
MPQQHGPHRSAHEARMSPLDKFDDSAGSLPSIRLKRVTAWEPFK